MHAAKDNIPLYQVVKQHILKLIEQGDWDENRRLPSENELVHQLSVSRMTVNRALRELVTEGHIERISGVGTFVAPRRAQSHPLEIRNIAEEIHARGHIHSAKVVRLTEVRAAPDVALSFDIAPGSRLFYSAIVHSESEMPVQYEERYVLPRFAPDYLAMDFGRVTTNEYLMKLNCYPSEIEQIVQAVMPTKEIKSLLKMSPNEPCLLLLRRTWVENQVVTGSRLYHPASRYQFGSRYRPGENTGI